MLFHVAAMFSHIFMYISFCMFSIFSLAVLGVFAIKAPGRFGQRRERGRHNSAPWAESDEKNGKKHPALSDKW